MVVNRITTMGQRAGGGGGAGQRSGAKGKITEFGRGTGNSSSKYAVSYTVNGQRGPHEANFMTKKGADLFVKAVKNGNGVKWSLDVAKKVDLDTRRKIVQGQVKAAASKKLSQMIHSGALKSQYPNGVPVGGTVTVTL